MQTNVRNIKEWKFKVRIPELRAIEGWYHTGRYSFKVSCRFRDILRCADTKHFTSCFRQWGMHNTQPSRRCVDPTWVIIFVLDGQGQMMGRTFAQYEQSLTPGGLPQLRVDKIYGNKLEFEDIKIMLKHSISCRNGGTDTYIRSES
jgi:hypothetical protein